MSRSVIVGGLAVVVFAAGFGCTKTSSQSLAVVANNLVMSGIAIDASSAPVTGATITAEQDPTVLATTDGTGAFSISMTRPQVAQIGNTMDHQRLSFVLYIHQASQNLYAATAPISLSDIGVKNLGSITVGNAGGYSGKVFLAHAGQIKGVSGDSRVYVGPVQATVKADGSFSADKVPAGKMPLTVTAAGMHAFYDQVELSSGAPQVRADPIILFSGTGPDGIVMEKAGASLADLVKGGHPTSKRFAVHPADQTAYVRFSSDQSRLQALGTQDRLAAAGKASGTAVGTANLVAPSTVQSSSPVSNGATPAVSTPATISSPGVSQTDMPWYPVSQDFDFDFPQSGGQVLYYQFADSTKLQASSIYQAGVDVDPFADSDGFVIGDGSGASPTSRVKLTIHVPSAAVSMRFAQDDVSIGSAFWRPIDTSATFDFLPSSTDPGTGSTALARELFCQFQDAYGHTSGLYHATTTLNLFSGLGIKLGDGSGFLSSQVVPVSINLPPGATKMRIDESLSLIKNGLWQTAAATTQFLFVPQQDPLSLFYFVGGNRDVCVQVEDDNAFISQVSCQKVNIDLFSMPAPGFQINGGATRSTSRLVTLQINVPPNALEMRIFENAPDNGVSNNGTISVITVGGAISTVAERTWLAAASQATFTFSSSGSKALFLQFRTKGGLVSSAYEQNITVVPFTETYGRTYFTVDNLPVTAVAPTVIDGVLSIDIFNLPESAIKVGIAVVTNSGSNALNQAATNNLTNGAITQNWRDPYSHQVFSLQNTGGPKTIAVQFMNSDGDLSGVMYQNIFFDPFPANTVSLALGSGTVVANAGSNVASVNIAMTAPNSMIAKEMRFSAVPLGSPANFGDHLPFAPTYVLNFPVVGTGTVQYTIWAQLNDINGNVSSVYSQNISLTIPPVVPPVVTVTGP